MPSELEFRVFLAVSQALLGGALVLGLGRMAMLIAKRPATRERLGTWAIRVALLVPLLVLLPGWWTLPWPTTASGEWPSVEPPRTACEAPEEDVLALHQDDTIHALDTLVIREWFLAEEANPVFAWMETPAASSAPEPEPRLERSEVEPQLPAATFRWPEWLIGLMAIYSLIAAYFLAEFFLGHVGLWRLRRGSQPAPQRVQTTAQELAPFSPVILTHDQVSSPICFGVVTPTILLPTTLAQRGSVQELRWILAHEADHLQRGDPFTGWLAGIARALFFFCPWFWTLRREFTLAQEQLADAAAVQAGGEPIAYAEFLMLLSTGPHPSRRRQPLPAHGVQAGRSHLFRRIDMVLAHVAKEGHAQAQRWGWLTASGLLTIAVLASGWTFATAEEPKPKTIILEARAEGDGQGKPKVVIVEGKPAEEIKNVTMTVMKDPKQAEKVAEVKAKIAAAMKAGKVEDAMKLIDELEKLLAPKVMTFEGRVKPVPPMPPAAPPAPGAPVKPVVPLPPGKVFDGESRNFLYYSDSAKAAIDGLKKQLSQTADGEAKKAIEAAIKALENIKPLVRPLEIKPGQLDINPEKLARVYLGGGLLEERLGLSVSEVPEALADQLNIERTGALIVAIKPGSIGAEAGFRVHDIITKVGPASIKNDKALSVELSKLTPDAPVEIKLLRKGQPVTVTLTMPKPKNVLVRSGMKIVEAPKVRFEAMQVQVNGDNFQISAKKADSSYTIEGKLNKGLPSEMSIQVKVGEKVLKATSPELLPEPHAAAVKSLLSHVSVN